MPNTRITRALLGALMCAALVAAGATQGAHAARNRALPDFIINLKPTNYTPTRIQTFPDDPTARHGCALPEGYISSSGTHTVVRFSTAIANIGGDFHLGKPGGGDMWEWGTCHDHWHVKGYAKYELFTLDGQPVGIGRKVGFCVLDYQRYLNVKGHARYTCDNQGLSYGWQDIYSWQLDGQWIEIDGLPLPGDYLLRMTVNPDRVWPESNYGNNTSEMVVHLEAPLVD